MAILFHSKNPETQWLSNFSPHGFTLSGMKWRSVEHYYQAAKYSDAELREKIRLAPTALEARKAGQNRSHVVRSDWEEIKIEIMRQALKEKFSQNRRLKEQLLGTGEEELVHLSSSDLLWGRDSDGNGENLLGALLMELRSRL